MIIKIRTVRKIERIEIAVKDFVVVNTLDCSIEYSSNSLEECRKYLDSNKERDAFGELIINAHEEYLKRLKRISKMEEQYENGELIISDGIATWKSNSRCIPMDCLKILAQSKYGYLVDAVAHRRARDKEVSEEFDGYKRLIKCELLFKKNNNEYEYYNQTQTEPTISEYEYVVRSYVSEYGKELTNRVNIIIGRFSDKLKATNNNEMPKMICVKGLLTVNGKNFDILHISCYHGEKRTLKIYDIS